MWLEYYNILKGSWYGASVLNIIVTITIFLFTTIKDKNDNFITSIEVLRDDILKKRENKLSLFIKKIVLSNGAVESVEEIRDKKEILIKLDNLYEYKQKVDKHFKKHHNSEQKALSATILIILTFLIGFFPEKYLCYSKDISFMLNIGIFIYLSYCLASLIKSKTEIRKINNDQDLKC